MSLLLDTHELLWFREGNSQLGVRARAAIREGADVAAPRRPAGPGLVAQARMEGLMLVTADPAMQAHDVALLDATR